MNDVKPVVKQVKELQIIIYEMKVEGMSINSNFLRVLKIRVEEDNMMNEKKHSKDGKKDYTQQKNYNFKKVYHCWVCGKPGYKYKDCRHEKVHEGGNSKGNFNQANHVESLKEFAGVIESLLTTNVVDRTNVHGNGTASKIDGKGKVILKITSRMDLVLSNVLHVPNITKNMISGPILSNKRFKLIFESDKFVITKGGVYVGKGYLDEGLFKLSVVTDDNDINNNNTAGTCAAFVYMIDPSFLWHSRLGHANFCSLQRMINLGMFPKCSNDKISKC
nr:Pol polyprotein [Tanacetum cinerariifolium]